MNIQVHSEFITLAQALGRVPPPRAPPATPHHSDVPGASKAQSSACLCLRTRARLSCGRRIYVLVEIKGIQSPGVPTDKIRVRVPLCMCEPKSDALAAGVRVCCGHFSHLCLRKVGAGTELEPTALQIQFSRKHGLKVLDNAQASLEELETVSSGVEATACRTVTHVEFDMQRDGSHILSSPLPITNEDKDKVAQADRAPILSPCLQQCSSQNWPVCAEIC